MENSKNFIRVDDGHNGNPKFVMANPNREYVGGHYVMTPGEATEEEIALMKEQVVEKICNDIRKIAKEREDFFIIKTDARFPGLNDEIATTVGAKFILPTVKADT